MNGAMNISASLKVPKLLHDWEYSSGGMKERFCPTCHLHNHPSNISRHNKYSSKHQSRCELDMRRLRPKSRPGSQTKIRPDQKDKLISSIVHHRPWFPCLDLRFQLEKICSGPFKIVSPRGFALGFRVYCDMLLQVVRAIEGLITERTREIVVLVMGPLVSSQMLLSLELLCTSDIITRKSGSFLNGDIVIVEHVLPLRVARFLSTGLARWVMILNSRRAWERLYAMQSQGAGQSFPKQWLSAEAWGPWWGCWSGSWLLVYWWDEISHTSSHVTHWRASKLIVGTKIRAWAVVLQIEVHRVSSTHMRLCIKSIDESCLWWNHKVCLCGGCFGSRVWRAKIHFQRRCWTWETITTYEVIKTTVVSWKTAKWKVVLISRLRFVRECNRCMENFFIHRRWWKVGTATISIRGVEWSRRRQVLSINLDILRRCSWCWIGGFYHLPRRRRIWGEWRSHRMITWRGSTGWLAWRWIRKHIDKE